MTRDCRLVQIDIAPQCENVTVAFSRRAYGFRGWLIPVGVGVVCVVGGRIFPLASPLLVSLAIGVLVANISSASAERRAAQAQVAKTMLRVGVVMLGLRLPFGDIVGIGAAGFAVIAATVALTYWLTCLIGDRLGLERGLVTLIASGFAVCGAAAIAAVEDGIRSRRQDTAVALSMVTVFGSAMIVAVPAAAEMLGMSDRQLGMWAGASIHEVAQVVAAASAAGAMAVATATTVKLGRVATLAVVYVLARARHAADRRAVETTTRPRISSFLPWFVVGFLAMAAVRSTGVVPAGSLNVLDLVTTALLAAGMYGLGLGIRVASLLPLPLRAVLLSLASTAVAATVSGILVLALVD